MCRQQIWDFLPIPREVARPPAVCTLPGGWFVGAKSRGEVDACFLLLKTGARNGGGVFVGCRQQNQITMGFRPGNPSSGVAACFLPYAAATTAREK